MGYDSKHNHLSVVVILAWTSTLPTCHNCTNIFPSFWWTASVTSLQPVTCSSL